MSKCYYYDPDNEWCDKYNKRITSDYTRENCCRTDRLSCDKFCYLTTSMCEILEKPDDCFELTEMRKLRDTVMLNNPKYDYMIEEYYKTAPEIVVKLKNSNSKNEIAQTMQASFILPISNLMKKKENDAAVSKYLEMIDYVKNNIN